MNPSQEIPLFLLDTVLFPGGRLPLRVFETRYMDMVKDALRTGRPFGICLLAAGEEVARPGAASALPCGTGTLATVADWDMAQLGILDIVAHGGQRFRVLAHHRLDSGLVTATAELLPDPPVTPIPGDYARLVPMLRALVDALEEIQTPKPHRFYDATWVAYRWAELLPLPREARQRLLELDDGAARLDTIYRFLEEAGDAPE